MSTKVTPEMVHPIPKKRKVKVTLKKKRLENRATQIQSNWRGHQIRKTIEQKKAEKAHQSESEENVGNKPEVDPTLNAEEEKLETFRKIPFDQLSRVQFYVDSAVGLPDNCTISRVSGRLLRPDRTEVSSIGTVETFTDPRSDASNPAINLFLSWKASVLDPSATILCRIDTLDRIDLFPRTVGYAALKLFVTGEKDAQPDSSTALADVSLNAGRFSVPILLGTIPDWCPLTEERIEDLPCMPGASLIVRLFDASVESPPPQVLPKVTSEINTCAELVYSTFDNLDVVRRFEKSNTPAPPHWDTFGSDIEMGRDLAEEDWKILIPLLLQWCQRVFPLVHSMREIIDLNFAKRYSNDPQNGGLIVGLDMLYNLPRPNRSSKLPNSIVTYKATFQYLPGHVTKSFTPETNQEQVESNQDAPNSDDPRYVVDDVTRHWDIEASTDRCPVFIDDFKATTGLTLGPEACLLIFVQRVDISFKSEQSYDLVMPFRRPDCTWWTIFPLRTDSPYYTPEGSLLEDKECNGAYANSGTHHVPLFNGLPPLDIIESSDPFQSLLYRLQDQTNQLPSHSLSCIEGGGLGVCSDINIFSTEDDDSNIVLSESGASAIIRIHEKNMSRFINEHIKVDGSLLPSTKYLQQILDTQVNSSNLKRLYSYEPLKYVGEPSMKQLIPSRYSNELYLLTDAINIKFQQDIQEYVDNLP